MGGWICCRGGEEIQQGHIMCKLVSRWVHDGVQRGIERHGLTGCHQEGGLIEKEKEREKEREDRYNGHAFIKTASRQLHK